MKRYALLTTLMLTACLTPTGKQKPVGVMNYGQHGAGSAGIHTVLGGDTVYTVSKRYNLPLREIITLNDLSAPYHLNMGYRLKLPPPNEYKVQPGDTLNNISKLFEVSLSEVARQNNLSAPFTIEKGQVIRLPSPQPKLAEEFAVNPTPASFETNYVPPVKIGSVEAEVLAPPPGQGGAVEVASTTATGFPPQPTANAPGGATAQQPAKVQTVSAATPQVAPKIPARSGSGRFMRPVDGKVISSYGPKEGGLHNDGVNIKATKGTAVRAAENGVVAYTGSELQGYGNLVLVRHADRWMTAYAHLDKTLVKKGDVVKVGQSLGTVGATGQVDSPQLHFEVRRGTQALNPDLYL